METSVCKDWTRADAIKVSSESDVNQSHSDKSKTVKAPVTAHSVSMQSTRRSRDPRLAHITPPIQQQRSMIQPAVSPSQRVTILKIIANDPRDGLPLLLSHSPEHDPATQPAPAMISLPSGQPIHTFRVDGPVILSHTVEGASHAAKSVVDPSNSTKGQPSCRDVKAREAHDDDQTIVPMMFKTALKEFVTKQIEKTARYQGQSKEELRDLIVHKTVENIMHLERNFPSRKERIGAYLSSCKGKIKKLIQEYFHMYEAESLQ